MAGKGTTRQMQALPTETSAQRHNQARGALADSVRRTADLIRSIPDTSIRIPSSDWTVGEGAAHLVVIMGWFSEWAAGGRSLTENLDELGAVNARAIGGIPERDGVRLADRLLANGQRFLETSAGLPADSKVAWHEGYPLSLGALIWVGVGEMVIHGYDIARAAKKPWPIDRQLAYQILNGEGEAWPLFVDRKHVRGVTASYEITLRGGPKQVFRFVDGRLTVEPPSSKPVDCRISADPVAFLLVGYGRVSQWPQIAQGKVVAWGRKPWLGIKFRSLLRKNP
jgi:uncharacterized protein (TIGR03083 family)